MQSNTFEGYLNDKYLSDKDYKRREDKSKSERDQLFQKACGRYCYTKYHPVDEEKVIQLAHEYYIVNTNSDPDHNYYKALCHLRSKIICKANTKCCSYWDCKCIRERF